MKKFLLVLFVCVCALACFSACSNGNENGGANNDNDPNYGIVSDDEAHYIVFLVEAQEFARMHVVPTDTYESLEPYFPLVPDREGFIGEWEIIEDIYSDTSATVYINAYYFRVQP